jgi:PAS domain S-box-containing protein
VLPAHLLGPALESAPDAIVIADAEGRILFANQQVAEVFGYPQAELLGLDIESLLPERFRGGHVQLRATYAAAPRVRSMGVRQDLVARRRDGSEFPVEVSLSPIRDGDRTLVAAAIRDVTERRKIQAELVAAREAAERANQAKSRFLATASHDLRQPLQTLTLLNGTLRRIVHDSEAAEILQHQAHAVDGMSRLLNALLDISKLESGAVKPNLSDFNVATLFEEMRAEFAAVAASKGLELRVSAATNSVHSDPSLVGQILRNLLSNAIKYTRKGWVALRCLQRPNAVRIEVADSGVGMPADRLPFIYDEFYQLEAAPGVPREGYGLGLSIVQRLAALLRARLNVTSEPGRGSVFSMELPLANATVAVSAARATAPVTKEDRPIARRILLVEDDPAVRNATRMLLSVEGYEVVPAASRAEALEKVKANGKVDLLITDYHLGGVDKGTDVIASVRAILGRNVGAILVTGDTSSTVRELRHDARLRTVNKPVDAEELLGLIRALFEA